ncbi:hypothetical protein KIPB_001392 [Kipferlia bialata]|uniref:Uncharacterized protein n=1 Tax=Kipferlia bialata TaxID=797122 RepID=A0A9K3CQ01_9EUKA|nr:hypothetical protein KIPB_001392 [Kipferlia bialata]|eukprot:g1392.t1
MGGSVATLHGTVMEADTPPPMPSEEEREREGRSESQEREEQERREEVHALDQSLSLLSLVQKACSMGDAATAVSLVFKGAEGGKKGEEGEEEDPLRDASDVASDPAFLSLMRGAMDLSEARAPSSLPEFPQASTNAALWLAEWSLRHVSSRPPLVVRDARMADSQQVMHCAGIAVPPSSGTHVVSPGLSLPPPPLSSLFSCAGAGAMLLSLKQFSLAASLLLRVGCVAETKGVLLYAAKHGDDAHVGLYATAFQRLGEREAEMEAVRDRVHTQEAPLPDITQDLTQTCVTPGKVALGDMGRGREGRQREYRHQRSRGALSTGRLPPTEGDTPLSVDALHSSRVSLSSSPSVSTITSAAGLYASRGISLRHKPVVRDPISRNELDEALMRHTNLLRAELADKERELRESMQGREGGVSGSVTGSLMGTGVVSPSHPAPVLSDGKRIDRPSRHMSSQRGDIEGERDVRRPGPQSMAYNGRRERERQREREMKESGDVHRDTPPLHEVTDTYADSSLEQRPRRVTKASDDPVFGMGEIGHERERERDRERGVSRAHDTDGHDTDFSMAPERPVPQPPVPIPTLMPPGFVGGFSNEAQDGFSRSQRASRSPMLPYSMPRPPSIELTPADRAPTLTLRRSQRSIETIVHRVSEGRDASVALDGEGERERTSAETDKGKGRRVRKRRRKEKADKPKRSLNHTVSQPVLSPVSSAVGVGGYAPLKMFRDRSREYSREKSRDRVTNRERERDRVKEEAAGIVTVSSKNSPAVVSLRRRPFNPTGSSLPTPAAAPIALQEVDVEAASIAFSAVVTPRPTPSTAARILKELTQTQGEVKEGGEGEASVGHLEESDGEGERLTEERGGLESMSADTVSPTAGTLLDYHPPVSPSVSQSAPLGHGDSAETTSGANTEREWGRMTSRGERERRGDILAILGAKTSDTEGQGEAEAEGDNDRRLSVVAEIQEEARQDTESAATAPPSTQNAQTAEAEGEAESVPSQVGPGLDGIVAALGETTPPTAHRRGGRGGRKGQKQARRVAAAAPERETRDHVISLSVRPTPLSPSPKCDSSLQKPTYIPTLMRRNTSAVAFANTPGQTRASQSHRERMEAIALSSPPQSVKAVLTQPRAASKGTPMRSGGSGDWSDRMTSLFMTKSRSQLLTPLSPSQQRGLEVPACLTDDKDTEEEVRPFPTSGTPSRLQASVVERSVSNDSQDSATGTEGPASSEAAPVPVPPVETDRAPGIEKERVSISERLDIIMGNSPSSPKRRSIGSRDRVHSPSPVPIPVPIPVPVPVPVPVVDVQPKRERGGKSMRCKAAAAPPTGDSTSQNWLAALDEITHSLSAHKLPTVQSLRVPPAAVPVAISAKEEKDKDKEESVETPSLDELPTSLAPPGMATNSAGEGMSFGVLGGQLLSDSEMSDMSTVSEMGDEERKRAREMGDLVEGESYEALVLVEDVESEEDRVRRKRERERREAEERERDGPLWDGDEPAQVEALGRSFNASVSSISPDGLRGRPLTLYEQLLEISHGSTPQLKGTKRAT